MHSLQRRGSLARRRSGGGGGGGGGTYNIPIAADADDGYAYRWFDTNWPPATADNWTSTAATLNVAKEASPPYYQIFNIVLSFDTAVIPDAETVTSATLELTNSDDFGAFFNTDSKTMSGGWYVGSLAATAYTATAETTAFSGFNHMANTTSGALRTITLSSAAANVSKTAATKLRLHLSDGGTPTGRNLASFADYAHATLAPPRLVVTTTA